jgi:hypothetical protein
MVKALGTKTISKNTKLNLTNTSCNIHMKNIGSKTKESIIQYFGLKDQVEGTNATSLSSAYCSSNFSLFLIGILLTGVVMYYLSLQNPRLETRSRFKGKFGNRIYGCCKTCFNFMNNKIFNFFIAFFTWILMITSVIIDAWKQRL